MSNPTSPTVDEKSPAGATDVEAAQLKTDPERISSAIARLTSNSIAGLEGLSSELQDFRAFLHSEVHRVEGEIDSALAGIKIIIETLEPLKNRPADTHVSPRPERQRYRSFG
jgi:hypothetical protein